MRSPTDGDIPAPQGMADRDRLKGPDARDGADDGCLGRPVGVPHLTALGETPTELGRAGLATQDDQSDLGQRLALPHRGQGRHGRDHRHVVLEKPGSEFHAGLHQRAWTGHERGPVAPRQPHLLATGVEAD